MASTKESKGTPASTKEKKQMLIFMKQDADPLENLFDEMIRVNITNPVQRLNPTKESKKIPGSTKES